MFKKITSMVCLIMLLASFSVHAGNNVTAAAGELGVAYGGSLSQVANTSDLAIGTAQTDVAYLTYTMDNRGNTVGGFSLTIASDFTFTHNGTGFEGGSSAIGSGSGHNQAFTLKSGNVLDASDEVVLSASNLNEINTTGTVINYLAPQRKTVNTDTITFSISTVANDDLISGTYEDSITMTISTL
jgi:hypothetical protein